MNRRDLLKTAASSLFVASAPAIIRPSSADAQLLNLKFGASVPIVAAPSSIPLSYTDPRFASNTQEDTYNAYWVPLNTSQTFNNKDWDYRPSLSYGDEYIRWNGDNTTLTQNRCRCYAREGIHMNGVNQTLNSSECFFLLIGNDPGDHADGNQGFCKTSTVNWTNVCVRIYSDPEAKALLGSQAVGSDGFRWTDDPTGTVNFTNVVFRGGGRGISIVADSPTITINFENVYFVEIDNGFKLSDHYLYRLGANSDGNFVVGKWVNVCMATIDGSGNVIPGTQLPSPGNRTATGGENFLQQISP